MSGAIRDKCIDSFDPVNLNALVCHKTKLMGLKLICMANIFIDKIKYNSVLSPNFASNEEFIHTIAQENRRKSRPFNPVSLLLNMIQANHLFQYHNSTLSPEPL